MLPGGIEQLNPFLLFPGKFPAGLLQVNDQGGLGLGDLLHFPAEALGEPPEMFHLTAQLLPLILQRGDAPSLIIR